MAKEKKEVKNNKDKIKKSSKDKTSFMKSFRAELKKVIWPTPKQLFNNTVAVLAIVLITTAIVFVLDFVFESMNKYGIDKIKESVVNTLSTNETENTTTDDNSTETTDSDIDSDEDTDIETDTENETTETDVDETTSE